MQKYLGRRKTEFEGELGHIPNARLLPVGELAVRLLSWSLSSQIEPEDAAVGRREPAADCAVPRLAPMSAFSGASLVRAESAPLVRRGCGV